MEVNHGGVGPDEPHLGGMLGGDDSDETDFVRYNGILMRCYQLEKSSFNTLFTIMADPALFFMIVEQRLNELNVAFKSKRKENEWIWHLAIAKD